MKKGCGFLALFASLIMMMTLATVLAEVPDEFSLSAAEFAEQIQIGWNLGGSLDAHDPDGVFGAYPATEQIETCWNNPAVSKEIFQRIKGSGFQAVRIPVSWYNFVGPEPAYQIREDWITRVQEVVDEAISAGLYTVINIQHDRIAGKDGQWQYPQWDSPAVMERYEKIWAQIAARFRSYSGRLVFEGIGDVQLFSDTETNSDAVVQNQCGVINELNRRFVETVRRSGGNNRYRYLMCSVYASSARPEEAGRFQLPEDTHLIASAWLDNCDVLSFQEQLAVLKTQCSDNGIPVVIGEWKAGNSVPEISAEDIRAGVLLAEQYRVKLFLWDDGGRHRLFNRTAMTWEPPLLIQSVFGALNR